MKKSIMYIMDKAETFYIDVYRWNREKIIAIAVLSVMIIALTIILMTI